jgi:hypothetical protein
VEAKGSFERFQSPIILEKTGGFLMSQFSKAGAATLQIPRWIYVFAGIAAFLLAVGASISLVAPQQFVTPGVEINSAAQIYAGYTFSRDLGLFIVLCIGLIKRSRSIMTVMLGLFSLINFCDALMDIKGSRLPVFVIAFLLSLIAAMATIRLSKTDQPSVIWTATHLVDRHDFVQIVIGKLREGAYETSWHSLGAAYVDYRKSQRP